MKNLITKTRMLVLVVLVPLCAFSQLNYRSASSSIVIAGTSTLHDWEMKSSNGTATAVFIADVKGQLTGITSLSFTMGSNTIKSGKDGMDDNAYKALKTSQYKTFQYTASTGTVSPAGTNKYQVKCQGVLTIAGRSVNTELVATCTYNPADGSLVCTGTKALKMTDYGVKPPSFMMGTIKTGDPITVNFSTILKK